jgi:hypothetical protein
MKYYFLTNTANYVGFSGERLKTHYDIGKACPNCGTGYKLIGNLIVDKIKTTLDFFETNSGDFLVSEVFYNDLKRKGIILNGIKKVIDNKTKAELPYYHLFPAFNFPKMLPDSEGIVTDEQCLVCKRNGFFDERILPVSPGNPVVDVPRIYKYNFNEIKDLAQSDIYCTWEHFGYSNLFAQGKKMIRYARPGLIVTENVKATFESLKLGNAKFEEVYLIHITEA